ncbi:hypothetical protein MUK42_04133 [Musa troglodytarum]|uniref:Uncharacterized protein n=1 Tax=Musa troglodytarum TaxID=320322 RepID=A0A9E7GIY1_9LILI|nr:hypothetical protein MUK42_04133 [Musa troglodytarum]
MLARLARIARFHPSPFLLACRSDCHFTDRSSPCKISAAKSLITIPRSVRAISFSCLRVGLLFHAKARKSSAESKCTPPLRSFHELQFY